MSEFSLLSPSHWAAILSGMTTPTTCTLLYGKSCYNLRDFFWASLYYSVPHLPLTWRFAEQPWRVSLTVFPRYQSWRHLLVCASPLRSTGFVSVKVNKAKLKTKLYVYTIPSARRLPSWVTSLCASIVQIPYISKWVLIIGIQGT